MRLKNISLYYGSQIFKSFADESRIRIMNILFHKKEATISDLERTLDFTQTKTSRHISYLKNAGLVSAKKIDQFVFYYVKEEAVDISTQMIKFLHRDSQLLQDLNAFDTLHSNRELSINKLNNKTWQR